MTADNPFLQLTLPRATHALGTIKSCIWREVAEVEVAFAGSSNQRVEFAAAMKLAYTPVKLPFLWGKLFDQGWFHLTLPPQMARNSGPVYLFWNDQGEGTAYVDGVPFYGFDVAHRHCALPGGTREIFIESLCLQSAIWHPQASGLDPDGSKLSHAALVTRDDLAWEAYHDFVVLYDLALDEIKANGLLTEPLVCGSGYHPPINTVSVLCRRLLRTLDDAVNALDEGGLPAASKILRAAYNTFAGKHDQVRAVLTGHAHIDLVWMWPEASAEYKAIHTFSTMNRLMDLYPEFVFGYSQPASYDAVERISPALLDAVKNRIGQGVWEPLGACEVESDTMIACGEALARSFMLGQDGFRRLQGKPSRICWLPDVFGYCGSLPQIMHQTGVDYFFTTKLTWSNVNLFPYSSFVWRGIDGTEVLVHVTQENGYTQTGSVLELRRGARAYRQSDVHDEFLAPTGYGDGGGGVTEEMCERARRYKTLAGMPETKWGRVDAFFDRLNEVRSRLPVYQGELYLEYHRGVMTTHGDLKEAFRACERALQIWESTRCANGAGEIDVHPWKRLVFAQFHDYIPGTSIWEVYEEGIAELRKITSDALAAAAAELGASGESTGQLSLFNPLPIARRFVLRDTAGQASKLVQLPPLSGAAINQLQTTDTGGVVNAAASRLSVNFPGTQAGNQAKAGVSAEFDERGQLKRLAFGGCEIPLRGPLAELVLYSDKPHAYDAWDIDRQTLNLGQTADKPAEIGAIATGTLDGSVEFRRKLGAQSSVVIRYRLDVSEPVLHIEYEFDWHEEQTLLKVHFPTAYVGQRARFGAPFGSVLRGQQPGAPQDEARFESAGSRWAVVSDDGGPGLGVITEAKYGWSCQDGNLGLSLLRAAKVTGSDGGGLFPPAIRRPRADGQPRERYSDQGQHTIRLALCLHDLSDAGNVSDIYRNAAALADTLFTPPLAYHGEKKSSGFEGLEDGGSLVPCWAKPAADGQGWILRLHETLGLRGVAKLRLADGYRARRTDLSENVCEDAGVAATEIAFSPYELISMRICR